jgi:hypothetical protein
MDSDRLDALLATLTRSPSRRSALRVLVGFGLTGLLGRAESAVTRDRKRRRRNRRRRSRPSCRPNCDRRICGDDGCGGSCGACAVCQTCQAGICITQPDNAPCGASGRCFGGTCIPRPTCLAFAEICTVDAECCSNDCGGGTAGCNMGMDGRPCFTGNDCLSAQCVGYVCRPP